MSDERPVVNIVGEKVALGPFTRDLLPAYHRWHNDFTMWRTEWPVGAQPMTMDQVTAWYEGWAKSPAERRIDFAVYKLDGWAPIGMTSLHDLDWRAHTAEFGITIGEPSERGKGYGTEAAGLTLDYAFTALALHNVALTALEFNLGGLRAYTKAGFREYGRRREAVVMNGRRWDIVYMDCLASEFESSVLAQVFKPDEPR